MNGSRFIMNRDPYRIQRAIDVSRSGRRTLLHMTSCPLSWKCVKNPSRESMRITKNNPAKRHPVWNVRALGLYRRRYRYRYLKIPRYRFSIGITDSGLAVNFSVHDTCPAVAWLFVVVTYLLFRSVVYFYVVEFVISGTSFFNILWIIWQLIDKSTILTWFIV